MEYFSAASPLPAEGWVGTLRLTDGRNTGWSFDHNLPRYPYLERWIYHDDHIVGFRFQCAREEQKAEPIMRITAYLAKAENAEAAAAVLADAANPVAVRAINWGMSVADWIHHFISAEAVVTRPGFNLANRALQVIEWLDPAEIMERRHEETMKHRSRPG